MDALLLVGLHYAAKKLGPILYPEALLWEGGINLEILLFIHYELLIFNVLAICVCVWGGGGGGGGGDEVVLYHMYIKCYIRFCGCLARFLRYKTMFGLSPLYIVL